MASKQPLHKLRNQTFQWLEALAIIMVIDDHVSTRVGILSSIFPYNSFYMPMLVFISGYFFKERSIRGGVQHKMLHLFVPYVIWSLVGDALAYILFRCGIVNWWVDPLDSRAIQNLFFLEPPSSITGAGWFVIMLFWVEIGYLLLNKFLRLGTRKKDYVLLVILMVVGFIDLKLCMEGLPGVKRIYRFALRTIWYLQFYHMGRMFHLYWEKCVKHWRLLYTCGACCAVNVLLVCTFGDKVNFIATSGMGNFNSWWMPLCTSVTGTLFWYKITQMISSRIGQVNIVDFVAENTFTIMMCHLMFVNIPNFIVYFRIQEGSTAFSDFPVQDFVAGAWVRYSSSSRLAGFCCGLLGSLLVAWLIHKASKRLAGLR